MQPFPDISVNIPLELLDSLAEVIRVGLQRSKQLTPEQRKAVSTWWEAERDFIADEIENSTKK